MLSRRHLWVRAFWPTHFKPEHETGVHTDACAIGIGAILIQKN